MLLFQFFQSLCNLVLVGMAAKFLFEIAGGGENLFGGQAAEVGLRFSISDLASSDQVVCLSGYRSRAIILLPRGLKQAVMK